MVGGSHYGLGYGWWVTLQLVLELILMVFSMWYFLYAKITMVGGNRWIWAVATVDVGCGHGSDSE